MNLKGIDFEWAFKRLDLNTEIKPFESELKEFDDFLFDDAKNYLNQKLAVTYLLETDNETIAYFCIAHDCIKREMDREKMTAAEKQIWNKINRKIPFLKQRGYYPSVKIGRLAVAKKYAGNGFGRIILNTVKSMYYDDVQKAGCRFVSVDARIEICDFYTRNGFKFLTDKDADNNQRIMYFDLQAIS
jgi:Predicted acyltransferase